MSTRKLLDFHRPSSLQLGHNAINKETRRCIRNLAAYKVPKGLKRKGPRSRTAAVLVALFIGRMGDVYVLLSQRSKALRTYAGDTSLPGGKMEPHDRSIEDTARREAFEEIGLSFDKEKVPLLCSLEPFLAGNQLLVIPVVVLVLDKTIRPVLNQAEVSSLFSHPLKAFLSSDSPFPQEQHADEIPYYTYNDYPWYRDGQSRPIRMHRFLTGREAGGIKPVYGLTASILIRVAEVGFGRSADFEINAPGQPSMTERVDYALRSHPKFIEAFEEEELNAKSQSSHILKEFLRVRSQRRRRRIASKL
ncbi:PCD1 [Sanghuangporus vaninii]